VNARVFLAAIVALLAGVVVYDALALRFVAYAGSSGIGVVLAEALPALLVGLIFVVVVLMPLFALFRHMPMQRRARFILAGISMWAALGALLLMLVPLEEPSDFVGRAVLVLLPGVVVVLVFGATCNFE
jgi:hypothetical protein